MAFLKERTGWPSGWCLELLLEQCGAAASFPDSAKGGTCMSTEGSHRQYGRVGIFVAVLCFVVCFLFVLFQFCFIFLVVVFCLVLLWVFYAVVIFF